MRCYFLHESVSVNLLHERNRLQNPLVPLCPSFLTIRYLTNQIMFLLGVLNGIFYNAATTLKPTFANFYTQVTPANSEDIDAFVFDSPTQQYVVATDDAVTQAGLLET